LYQGLLRSTASWARVGRGYVGALLEMGVPVAAVELRGFRYDPSFALPEKLQLFSAEEARQRPPPELGLGCVHPPYLSRLLGQRKYNLFVWEADRVPKKWCELLQTGVDQVVVPSRFTRDALTAGGFPRERVLEIPLGYARSQVERALQWRQESDTRFTFFTVAAPHWRKGPRELLLGYRAAFSRADPVRLRIKTSYDPGAARRRFPFEIPSWKQLLSDCGLKEPDAPPVELIFTSLSDDELLNLYSAAHVYVAPTWGESFGLAILEAMAMARPVITTGWGGHLEFLPSDWELLPYTLQEGGEALYEPTPGAQVAVPQVDPLRDQLRWHFENRGLSRELGLQARQWVASMTWQNAAERLQAALLT
ncbi:MAG: glycosyltransferase family 4 protein, partial [Planctomycetota bacterium]